MTEKTKTMTEQHWKEVISCIENDRHIALQNMNNSRYNFLGEILIELEKLQNS